MTKIVTLTGAKYSKKDIVALKLEKNSSVEFVRPYSTKKSIDFNWVSKKALLKMLETEEVLLTQYLNGEVYCYFRKQFTADYCVVVVDDFSLIQLKKAWDGDIVTVKVLNDKSVKSDRVDVFLEDSDFDIIFDVNLDDIHMLEAQIE